MRLSDFDYDLPVESIAQHPLAERDASHMLLVECSSGQFSDRAFGELPDLLRGDELIVVNNARVIPARLFGRRSITTAKPTEQHDTRRTLRSRIEVLLVRRIEGDVWEALVRPGRKIRVGEHLIFDDGRLEAEVIDRGAFGLRRLRFHGSTDVLSTIERIGHMPLPPYIRRDDQPTDRERYQTIFAQRPGAVAAPTAGLHFTTAILEKLRARGIEVREITLEVGLGTFQPIRVEELDEHQIHAETYEISEPTAAAIVSARREGRPVLAVGTTVVRALEDAAQKAAALGLPVGTISVGQATANIFIRPGHHFALVDQILTNFHLPRSTLLVMMAAFAGRETLLSAYRHAVTSGYRFYSYGDCMLAR